MDVELTGIVVTDEMGLGRLGKHSLPHFRTSPVDHKMEGLWETSQGRPRTGSQRWIPPEPDKYFPCVTGRPAAEWDLRSVGPVLG